MSTPDIVTAVADAIRDDDENQSQRLLETYDALDAAGKKGVDDVFICLTGYCIASLVVRAPPLD